MKKQSDFVADAVLDEERSLLSKLADVIFQKILSVYKRSPEHTILLKEFDSVNDKTRKLLEKNQRYFAHKRAHLMRFSSINRAQYTPLSKEERLHFEA